jgi:agmatinase
MEKLRNGAGIHSSFLGSRGDYLSADVVMVGAPMDFTVSFRPGSRMGPGIIRGMSGVLETYSPYVRGDIGDIALFDHGDLELSFGNAKRSLEVIYGAAAEIFGDGKLPVFLGGEHLISLPVIRAAFEKYGDQLLLFHFDAHTDLREEYMGEGLSHATVIRRCMDFVKGQNIYQFGIRSGLKEEFTLGETSTNFYPFKVVEPLQNISKTTGDRPIYVTLDIDVVDPAYAPGTGTPEPGGCTSAEILRAVHLLGGCNIIGMDIVEVMGFGDPAGITGVLAAKIIREALIGIAMGSRREEG